MKTIAFIRSGGIYDDSRATKEIRTFLEQGYNVLVFGWDKDGCAQEKVKGIFSDSVEFHFYRKPVMGRLGYKGIIKMLGFFVWVYRNLKRNRKRIDVVHACDLDAGIGAYIFCKKHKRKLVYDIYDYYVDCHSLPKYIEPTVEKMEIRVINYAEATIICTEERKAQIKKAKPKKIVVIYNSPDIIATNNKEIKYDYCYCGLIGGNRLVQEIFEEYNSNSDLKFEFAGSGNLEKKAAEVAAKFEDFNYCGSISYDEVLTKESMAMALAAVYEPNKRNHWLCAPNKFYEAMALSRPVIVCKGTGIDEIVKREKIGIVIEYDVKQFYTAIRWLKENWEEGEAMGRRGRAIYEKQYKWSLMVSRLAELYKEVLV